MLNDLMDIFLGMYFNYVDPEYASKDYFISIIAVVITACMLIGSFALLIVVVSETFKTIRGSRS